MATFSLGDYWALPPKREKFSKISVEGVPGYPVPRAIFSSRAARAIASLPLNSKRWVSVTIVAKLQTVGPTKLAGLSQKKEA
jgi:hypothetical protein